MLSKDRLSDLLKKYDVPGPRYTSYPTVPAWVTSVGADDYEKNLKALKPQEKLSLYFHLPFCENLCHFCGCMQMITKDHSRSAEYVEVVLKEVEMVTALIPKGVSPPLEKGDEGGFDPNIKSPRTPLFQRGGISQLHFGGGSPNYLQPSELTQLVEKVRGSFTLLPSAEIAIEMHPRTSTKAFCENLAQLGFNRISLGVQDLDPKVQKLINRNQTHEMTRDMVAFLRSLGFDSFNMDLVYGLPGQNMQGWQKTLEQVLDMCPNRLAVYSYAHVPWVRPVQRTFEDSDIPSPEMKLKFFETAYEFFTSHGYRLIGMDHFALKDDELSKALETGGIHRNFMGYSTRADAHQIGFGVSSISYVNGNYFQNGKDLKHYYPAIRENRPATFRGFILLQDDALRRELITHVMCRGFVDIAAFEKKWKIRFDDYFSGARKLLQGFVEDGLLELEAGSLKIKGKGFLFLRNIAMTFDAYLENMRKKARNPIFSRTV